MNKFKILVSLAVLTTMSVGARARAQAEDRPQAPDSAQTTIARFAQVDVGVYRGGRPSAGDLLFLKSLDVRTDISFQGGDLDNPDVAAVIRWWEPGETPASRAAEKDAAEALRLDYVNLPLNSLAAVTPEEDARIDQALAMMADPVRQPLFVHCEHGQDRTGLVVALYRVRVQHWDVSRAYQEWTDFGHGGLSELFTGQLDAYFFAKAAALSKL